MQAGHFLLELNFGLEQIAKVDYSLKELHERINGVMAEWNPIGVPPDHARNEYASYVWQIIGHLQRNEDLYEYLKSILTERMGVRYDDAKPALRNELQAVCNQLREVYRQSAQSD